MMVAMLLARLLLLMSHLLGVLLLLGLRVRDRLARGVDLILMMVHLLLHSLLLLKLQLMLMLLLLLLLLLELL